MFKFSLSVRAYHTAHYFGFPNWENWATLSADTMRAECIRAGENVLARDKGKLTAVELFRASGLSVYQIHQYIPCMDIRRIKSECERLDSSLHQSLID